VIGDECPRSEILRGQRGSFTRRGSEGEVKKEKMEERRGEKKEPGIDWVRIRLN